MGVIPDGDSGEIESYTVASPLWGLFFNSVTRFELSLKLLPRYGGYSRKQREIEQQQQLFPRYGGYSGASPQN